MATTTRETEGMVVRKMTVVSRIFLVLSILSIIGAALAVFFVPSYRIIQWTLGLMGAALIFFLLWITTAFPQVKSYVGKRSTKLGLSTLMLSVIIAGIVTGLNYVAAKNEIEVDMTANQVQSLSDQTVKLLKGLTQDVEVLTFLHSDLVPKVTEFLKRYQMYSKKLHIRYVDLYAEPEVVRAHNVTQPNVLVFKSMTRQTRVEAISKGGQDLEEKVTNALIRVSKGESIQVCFLTGHGEFDIESEDPKRSLAMYRDKLKNQRYESKKINLLEVEKVPSDCVVLLVVGPEKALFDAEAQAISAYVDQGGKVAVFLDPYSDSSWSVMLRKWGVEIKNEMVVVENNPLTLMYGGSPIVPVIRDLDTTTPFFKDLGQEKAIVMHVATPVLVADKVKEGITVKAIAKTIASSWAESSDIRQVRRLEFNKEKDIKGPISVAVHVSGKSEKGKDLDLVVFGDSDFITDAFGRYLKNWDVSLNLVAYFAKDDDLISIRPREYASEPLNLTEQNMRVMYGLTFVLFPFLFFFAAGTVYLRRRSL